MTRQILFDPMLPWAVIAVLGGVALALCLLAALRGLPGWWLRALAVGVLTLALADPSLQTEEREPLSDILLVVVDESASQGLSDRAVQSEEALATLMAEAARDGLDTRIARVGDGEGDEGTLAMAALSELMAEVPRDRVAGAVVISDGQVHDAGQAPDLPAPLHLLRTGREGDWDRRLIVSNAPSFAILGEEFTITLRIEDQGDVPADAGTEADIVLSVDGGQPRAYRMPVGQDLQLPITLPHGGLNVIEFRVPEAEGELTDRNNAAVIQINGVRDRLRVLLVSGEPHPGQRTWRNLLKADSAVDLVHFTILRPPGKQDGVPVTELSLIAFPTRELFSEKIDEFDLIIFDRYQRRGILPGNYFENVRDYVEQGGALLIAAGPDFASADSLYRSPLSPILPARPTAIVIDQPFTPAISETGEKHPVTEGLPDDFGVDGAPWGRWFRQVQVEALPNTEVLMTGVDDEPLLVLDRVKNGRVALLGSDHVWLWDRGLEGGGPQAELLRRLAHWLMQEPELEEEALTAVALGQEITVTRRTLGDAPGAVTVTAPDGTETELTLTEEAPGRFVGRIVGAEQGLYRLVEGERTAVIGLGPAAPREFVETIATDAVLANAVAAQEGGALAIEAGSFDLRSVRAGRQAAGRGWIGWTPREAYLTADVRILSLVPAWLFLLLAASLATLAWLREGRQ
ncbi:hypothetical protein [Jannaschia pohangensis]|uniref:Glutamine amidotransferase n=1 Tax=Jannaschia pohangensis TaxID=390807 RepID=A0A1I3R302_9RHOB|nr:hypothetical protein [Jannaschia pohangensis]SFJ40495.1 hypothetical protein SAMN04488095_2762 [Jannaschia pohangensis]